MRRHLVTKGSVYERLADHGDEIVSDDDFAHLYADRRGRPSVPPSVMVRALLLATHDATSDRETSRRTRVDADWKAAMGVDDDFGGIGATTFSLFRARLVVDDADQALFVKTLEAAIDAKVLRGKRRAIIDSSPVRGAGAVSDTYELLRGFLAQAIRAGGEAFSAPTREVASPHIGEKPDIDWGDPKARASYLGDLVGAIKAVLAEARSIDDEAVGEAASHLAQVVDQDLEEGEDGEAGIRRGVGKDRIVSSSDPEMRHGHKSSNRRFDGHKMDLVTDEETELVLGIAIRAGNAPDGEGAVPLLEAVQGTEGVEVGALLGDMAYSEGDVRVAVEEEGTTLLAKVPPVSNSGRFPKTDFFIDTEAGEVTCPQGEVTTDARPERDHKGRPGLRFVFPAQVCGTCPVRADCVGGKAGRSVFVGVHEDRIAAARAAQADPEVKALLRKRAKVERKIDHLQDLGMRKARFRGRRRTRLQALLAATVANFSRLAVLGAFDQAPAPVMAA
ncbi:MAG TPA: IS1182 family transposase [Acidimicrobiales bacterium]|nr:IS1182 family transposase [Acidimicrobiales bacterium]